MPKVKTLLPLFVVVMAVMGIIAPMATAADFCALNVMVSGADGTPISSTWVELLDPSGRMVRREMVRATFEICDFGFGPHTLRVGTNECLPVSISNLRVMIGRPLTLKVVLNACGYSETMRNACLVYLRTVDSDKQPVGGVQFSPSLTLNQLPRTDTFGRWQGLFSGSTNLTFSKPGYEPASLRLECRESEEIDRQIEMKKSE